MVDGGEHAAHQCFRAGTVLRGIHRELQTGFQFAHAAVHGLHRRLRLLLDVADHAADLQSGSARALGQLAHFVGHHCKTAPGFSGARRLDGGVQRQQIGLVGDFLDHVDNLANFGAALL